MRAFGSEFGIPEKRMARTWVTNRVIKEGYLPVPPHDSLQDLEAKYYIGGLLKHASALMAFCAPTVNSYKRLVPGFEAPVNLAYSA